jgi:hypothetical protein
VIRPNELSNPGEREAWARVDDLCTRLDDRPDSAFMIRPPVPLPEEEREALMVEVEDLADGLGRGELLDNARDHVRDALAARFASPLRLYGAGGIYGSSLGGPEDVAAAVMAITDAVAVTVVEDRLDPRTAEALAGPGWRILGRLTDPDEADGARDAARTAAPRATHPTHASHAARRAAWLADHAGSPTDAPSNGGPPPVDPFAAGAPTANDWVEADQGATAIERGATAIERGVNPEATRAARVLGVVAVTALLAPAAFAAGINTGNPVIGALAAVLVVVAGGWLALRRPSG